MPDPVMKPSYISSACAGNRHPFCRNGCACECHDKLEEPTPTPVIAPVATATEPTPLVRWVTPPAIGKGGRELAEALTPPVLAELRRHPGRWAEVYRSVRANGASQMSLNIRRGTYKHLGSGWDATSRRDEAGGSVLYLCWIGEPDTPAG